MSSYVHCIAPILVWFPCRTLGDTYVQNQSTCGPISLRRLIQSSFFASESCFVVCPKEKAFISDVPPELGTVHVFSPCGTCLSPTFCGSSSAVGWGVLRSEGFERRFLMSPGILGTYCREPVGKKYTSQKQTLCPKLGSSCTPNAPTNAPGWEKMHVGTPQDQTSPWPSFEITGMTLSSTLKEATYRRETPKKRSRTAAPGLFLVGTAWKLVVKMYFGEPLSLVWVWHLLPLRSGSTILRFYEWDTLGQQIWDAWRGSLIFVELGPN